MNKQTAWQATRQERRGEEQRRREEERQRAARRKRITIFITVGAVALAVAGLIYLLVAQAQAPANAAYPAVDNISCQSTEQGGTHAHAHVTIYVNGQKTAVPANVGIAPDGSCLYWLHTHDDTGVIHIEAPAGVSATFGNFLDIWGQRFQQLGYPSQFSDKAGWQVYVNGKPFSGDYRSIPLQSHALITLAYHSPGVQPDTTYPWNGL
jgi:hypothetical protein